jgi:hypothetical protein
MSMNNFDDDDEEGFDFVSDGAVPSAPAPTVATPRVEQLRQAIEAYRNGQGPVSNVASVLHVLQRNIGEVMSDCETLMRDQPARRAFFAENLAVYRHAYEAITRMQTACAEEHRDWMQQGFAALEAAVADVNALVAVEEEE